MHSPGDRRPASHPLPYQPALDGLRGLAVAAVLAYHAGMGWARGGFLGVDAFFVLSGYLITGLLLTEWRESASLDLAAFWTRRARRLLPALFMLLAAVGCYALAFARPADLAGLRGDALATLAYVANWRPLFAGQSYFQQFSTPSPLLHTWSLAVEEQWYLLWPLLLLLVLRLRGGSRLSLVALSLALAAGSALLMAWLYTPGDPSRVYYGTDTRAQSLLVGAALAAWMGGRDRAPVPAAADRVLQSLALVCIVGVGWAWTSATGNSLFLYHGGFLLLALAVAVVIAATTGAGNGRLGAVLSVPPLRGLGKISYGVYLFHWPVYLVLTPDRTGWDGYPLLALRVAVTIAAAIASYQLVERPFRGGALRRSRTSWALAPAASAALVLGLLLVTRGSGSALAISSTPSAPPPVAGQTAPIRVLVVGDSVAFTMGQGLGRAESVLNLSVWNQAALGCGILRGEQALVDGAWVKQRDECIDWATRWRSYVETFQPDVVLVLAGAWDLNDRQVDGRVLRLGTPEGDEFASAELQAAIDVLSSRGGRVILLTTPQFQQPNLGVAGQAPRFDRARIDRFNELLEQVAQSRPDQATVLDLGAFVRSAIASDGGKTQEILGDGVHFTPHGADLVAQWLGQTLGNAAPARPPASIAADVSAAASLPGHWLDLLQHVPDTPATRSWVAMNDYARYRATFHVPLPPSDAPDAALFDYYRGLLFAPDGKASALAAAQATGIADTPPVLGEMRTRAGLTIADVDQDLRAGDSGMEVLRGRFTSTPPGGGGQGQVLRAAGNDYRLSSAAGAADDMLAASSGQRPSLADVPGFAVLLGALDRFGTYTALLSTDVGSYTLPEIAKRVAGTDADAARLQAVQGELQGETPLLPWQAFATGAGIDEQGSYTLLVLLQADEQTARDNVDRLRARIDQGTSLVGGQPFREIISSADISSDGPLVIAKLRSDRLRLWLGLQQGRDTLLLHE